MRGRAHTAESAAFDLAQASTDSPEFERMLDICWRASEPVRWTQQLGTRTSFARNQTIFCEGEECAHVYFVVSGAVRICSYLPDGRRQISDVIVPSDCFGFATQHAYSHTAEAASNVVVRRCLRSKLLSDNENLHRVRALLIASLSRRIFAMQDHLLMLGRQTSRERIATFLLMLFRHVGSGCGEAFEVPMSRRDIADYLGLTIETVCRELARLKRRRVIDLPSVHQLAVKNIGALHALMAGIG